MILLVGKDCPRCEALEKEFPDVATLDARKTRDGMIAAAFHNVMALPALVIDDDTCIRDSEAIRGYLREHMLAG